jgi:hypothetical protein
MGRSQRYLPVPMTEMWNNTAENYANQWNFLNCIGCTESKHVAIKCPARSSSKFYNYKHFYSILLHAVVDSNCKLITVNVGTVGRQSDARNFRTSSLYKSLERRELNVPPHSELPGRVSKVTFVLIGHEGYPLLPYLMRPYSARNLDKRCVCNYWLSRAQRSVECAFGIMCTKWQILLKRTRQMNIMQL